jgi:multiple sugar transport system substrate-binding protein
MIDTIKPAATTRRTVLKSIGAGAATMAFGGLARPAFAQSRTITIIFNGNTEGQVEALRAAVADFEHATGAKAELNLMDHEANKTAIRNFLVAGTPDVCFWFSGNRMKAFVEKGLFDDISDLVADEGYADVLGGTLSAVTVKGRQYGLPLAGTLWGNYYLKDVFEKNGLTAPTTWDETMAYIEAARSKDIVPLAFGSKEIWPAGGFFDEMNLRINGLDTHMALMDGKLSYLDPVLTPVFDHWEELIKAGFFLENHTSYAWQDAAPLLAQGKAGLMNLGNFIKGGLPEEVFPNLTFVPFPKIANIARFEDFSVDSVHIPTNAKNKELAREWLKAFYSPENLLAFFKPTGQIPPRNDLPSMGDPLVDQAVESMRTVAGTAQYYDRDTDPDMAQAGLKGFQEFMVKPERRNDILKRLETTRTRIYGPLA